MEDKVTNPFDDKNGIFHVLINDETNIPYGQASSTFPKAGR